MCLSVCDVVQVAVKIIDTRKMKDEYQRSNLHREARVMAILRHPNIVRLYETLKVLRRLVSFTSIDLTIRSTFAGHNKKSSYVKILEIHMIQPKFEIS